MDQRRRIIPIFRSLNQRNLILGCEREPILMLALFSASLILIGQTWVSIILGSALWILSCFFLQKLGKYDSQVCKVLVRHLRQEPVYSAKAYVWRYLN